MEKEANSKSDMRGLTVRVFFRSLLFETLWNYRSMQSVGFGLISAPVFKKLYGEGEDYRSAMLRHTDLVNTHPFMAPLLGGIVAKLESEVDLTVSPSYRKRVMAVLAAHGDRAFWGRLRPFSALAGTLVSLVSIGSAYGILTLIALLNVPQLVLRGFGFYLGLRAGLGALALFTAPRILRVSAFLSLASAFMTGALAAVCSLTPFAAGHRITGEFSVAPLICFLGIPALTCLSVRLGAPLTSVLYVSAFVGLTLCYMLTEGLP